MESVSKKSFDAADEVRTPDKTKLEIVTLGTVVAGRMSPSAGLASASGDGRSASTAPKS